MKKLLIVGDMVLGQALQTVLATRLSVPVSFAMYNQCLEIFLEESSSHVLIVHPNAEEAKHVLKDLNNTGEEFKALVTSFAPTSDENFQMPYDLEKLVAWVEERLK